MQGYQKMFIYGIVRYVESIAKNKQEHLMMRHQNKLLNDIGCFAFRVLILIFIDLKFVYEIHYFCK